MTTDAFHEISCSLSLFPLSLLDKISDLSELHLNQHQNDCPHIYVLPQAHPCNNYETNDLFPL